MRDFRGWFHYPFSHIHIHRSEKTQGTTGQGKTGKTFFTRVSSKLSFTIVLHYDPIRAEQNKIWLRCETFAQIFPILSRPRNNIRLFRSSVSRPYLLPLEYKTFFTTYTNVLLFFIYKIKKIPCFFIEFFYYFNTRLIKFILILCNIFIIQGKRFKYKSRSNHKPNNPPINPKKIPITQTHQTKLPDTFQLSAKRNFNYKKMIQKKHTRTPESRIW